MKSIAIVGVGLSTLALYIYYITNNPKVDVRTIDYISKTVTFQFRGSTINYTLGNPQIATTNGDYRVESATVGNSIVITVYKKGQIFSKQSIPV